MTHRSIKDAEYNGKTGLFWNSEKCVFMATFCNRENSKFRSEIKIFLNIFHLMYLGQKLEKCPSETDRFGALLWILSTFKEFLRISPYKRG